jgi:predicted membrane-bound dolichyl-phosphate-mannose-protein mannosyltransferase
MEERTHHDVYIKKMHDKTIETLREKLFEIVPPSIKKKAWGIADMNIWIEVYKITYEKKLLHHKKKRTIIAKFHIAHTPEYVSHIVVPESGKAYYERLKEIGEMIGYDRIYKKWETNGKNHVDLETKENEDK